MSVAEKDLKKFGPNPGIVFSSYRRRDAAHRDKVFVRSAGWKVALAELDADFARLSAAGDRALAAYANALRELAK